MGQAKEDQVDILQIYVTGLTSVLICILNVLSKSGFTAPVYLMHYNRDSNSYLPQNMGEQNILLTLNC